MSNQSTIWAYLVHLSFNMWCDRKAPEWEGYGRQHELWWEDFRFLVEHVQRHGVRAWIWSDDYWHHPEAFLQNMPRSVLQSNWYDGDGFDPLEALQQVTRAKHRE